MSVKTQSFSVQTKGKTEIIDITNLVQREVVNTGIKEGSALVFVPGATAGVTTIEYEPDFLSIIPDFLRKLFLQMFPMNMIIHGMMATGIHIYELRFRALRLLFLLQMGKCCLEHGSK